MELYTFQTVCKYEQATPTEYNKPFINFSTKLTGLPDDQFVVFSQGVGAKVDYLLQGDKGLFVGLQSDYVTNRISLNSDSASANVRGVTLGLRTDYRFTLGKAESHHRGLDIVPWIALLSQPDAKIVQLAGQTYQPSAWSIFPTLHLGYRF